MTDKIVVLSTCSGEEEGERLANATGGTENGDLGELCEGDRSACAPQACQCHQWQLREPARCRLRGCRDRGHFNRNHAELEIGSCRCWGLLTLRADAEKARVWMREAMNILNRVTVEAGDD